MSRILALDIGEQRTGFAITDEGQIIAQALPFTAPLANLNKGIAEIQKDYGFNKIVIGLPKTMSGLEGPQASKVREVGQSLAKEFNCPIEYFDERLTTKQASNLMAKSGNIPLDSLAAQQILEQYLQSRNT